ncbi:NAD(P)H-hydrate dehydratase [Tellurirhabdus rosea]|uniref:NAD(P)H-hydrate dehydratase n=1 Tax=Tellurirhabdus rosea TaxID=2674997 RepID=UPI0022516DF0|nr:NAD(P)H-hydrate dehydratase [Tellurirhabdus rosea]
MKILSVEQIRALDQYTIEHEPIAPINLMERAAQAFVEWFTERFDTSRPVKIFCGLGNNGGDGLAIARLLIQLEYSVQAFIVRYAPRESEDCMHNHRRLKLLTTIGYIEQEKEMPVIRPNEIVIDAILGSGLSRPAEGIIRTVIEAMNFSPAMVISVDIASGLYSDAPTPLNAIAVEPDQTVTFQLPKLAFMQPSNSRFVGEWHSVDIGLSRTFIDRQKTPFYYTTEKEIRHLLRRRDRFAHKGTFGHALLLAGSYGKIGAAVLASRACLRSGVGLLTVHVPHCGYPILQTAVPEAMCLPDDNAEVLTGFSRVMGEDWGAYSAVGIGPGIGKFPETLGVVRNLLDRARKPVVIDADALNLLGENRDLLGKLPQNSILTPHPREFERLTRRWNNDYEKLTLLREFAKKHQVIVVLKGAHTAIALPDGSVHFNSTGNPGMSTGGSGDVLTGILTALLAQGYDPVEAAVLGVYQHGAAGDRAAQRFGQTAITAQDIAESLRWE